MSSQDVFSKQVREYFKIEGDFSRVMVSGESVTIGECDVEARDVDGTDVSYGETGAILADDLAVSSSGKGLTVTVLGGSSAKAPYIITFLLKTSAGNYWELDIEMGVD